MCLKINCGSYLMKFKIGDVVKPIDESLEGKVIGIEKSKILVLLNDGFEEYYFERDLVHKTKDIYSEIETKEPHLQIIIEEYKIESVDLHFDALHFKQYKVQPHEVLSKQLILLKEAVVEAQKNKVNQLDIIHGKGEGILKNEVIKMLSKYKNMEPIKNKNQGVYSIRFHY